MRGVTGQHNAIALDHAANKLVGNDVMTASDDRRVPVTFNQAADVTIGTFRGKRHAGSLTCIREKRTDAREALAVAELARTMPHTPRWIQTSA
jgi:hypothetical protein